METLRIDGEYCLNHCDTIPHMATMPEACIDFSIFSPPFPSLYAYTSEASDIGNSEDLKHEAKLHLSFFYKQLARIVKPGRVIMVHVAQIPRMKRNGEHGLYDFRGLNIKLGVRAGLVWDYDWCITKNPQAQAIRTKSRELQFVGLERDRSKARGCLPDYMIKFRAPGENAVPITDKDGQSTDAWRQQWINWAEAAWTDIKETDTLNTKAAKSESDTKHICPLQLGLIDRYIRLYSQPGEIVFSPFTGVGSEGYTALKLGRRFYGTELKDEYFNEALKNLKAAIAERKRAINLPLFSEDELVTA